MSAIVLIPWAKTDWTDSKRLSANAKLPLNEEGVAQAEVWAHQLSDKDLQSLFASDELTSQETAKVVALPARIRVKTIDGLCEIDFGLWQGLTEETLRSRFPKVYRRWVDDPTSVCPPDGEDLTDAFERIGEALRVVSRKAGSGAVGVVMGPVACAVARCHLESRELKYMRELLTNEPVWYDNDNENPNPLDEDGSEIGESEDDGQDRRPQRNLGSL